MVAISLSAALRGISTTIAPSAARTVAPRLRPEISPTSPKIEPCADRHGLRRIVRVDLDQHRAVGDREQRGAGLVALEHDVAGAIGARLGIEHELAHLQQRQLVEDVTRRRRKASHSIDAAAARQDGELLLEDRLVGGLEVLVAVDELDDVIALVHAMLDQRIAGQRADHVDAGHGRLELGRELRIGVAVVAGELDAAFLDELARRRRAHAGDDAVAPDLLLAVAGVEIEPAGRRPSAARSRTARSCGHRPAPPSAGRRWPPWRGRNRRLRLRMETVLRCSGSAARPSAFSMPASPEPITVICSSTYSPGSSSWYWMCGRSPPSQRIMLGLPCVPMPRMTILGLDLLAVGQGEGEVALLAGDRLRPRR